MSTESPHLTRWSWTVREDSGSTFDHRNSLVPLPVIPADDSREGDDSGNMKLDCGYCGYSFHCPVLLTKLLPEPLPPALFRKISLAPLYSNFLRIGTPYLPPARKSIRNL